MIYTSTALVYEKVNKFPFSEIETKNLLVPAASYAFSKWMGERLCHFLSEDQELNFSIIRLTNVYGININLFKKKSHWHVIPELVSKVLSGQTPLEIYGNGKQKRAFVYVSDAAQAIINAMESSKSDRQIFNVSSKEEIEIAELISKIWQICERKDQLALKYGKSARFDLQRSFCNTAKIKKVLGWKTTITLDQGLKEFINWFRNNYHD